MRVDELQELLDQLPEECQHLIWKEAFSLIPTELCPKECALQEMPPLVETEEVLEAHGAIGQLYPMKYLEECKGVLKVQDAPLLRVGSVAESPLINVEL